MRYLITAGPTREFIDDVRYLTNASSGRMGCALAQAALNAGNQVTLICGPIECAPPDGATLVRVVSAAEMRDAVLERFEQAEVIIMSAAVADYRPAKRVTGKIKKTGRELVLHLEPTEDILAEIGRRKGSRILVGFALEAESARENALRKLREKNLDLVVVNSPAAMGAEIADAELLFASGKTLALTRLTKTSIARRIISAVEEISPT